MVRAILLEVCREVLPRERMTRTKRSLPRKPSAFPAASGSTPTSSLAGRQPLSGLQAGRTPCSIRSLEARAVSTATPTRPTQRILTSRTRMLLMVTPTCGGPIKTRLTFLVLSVSLVARRLRKPRRSPQTRRHAIPTQRFGNTLRFTLGAGSTRTWQMTQAFEACGEASRGMTSDAGQLEHGARGVPPFALHGTLCLAALLVLAACGPSQPSSPTRNVSTGAETVPDFAGAAEPIASLSSCPHILSPDLRNP